MAGLPCAGIDGARGGWVGWLVETPGTFTAVHADAFASLVTALPGNARIWVDMPIGLPAGQPHDDGRRACDRLARQSLGGRLAARVFSAPIRAVLDQPSYDDACRISRERTGRALSLQTWNICSKIGEVDRFLRTNVGAANRIREAHPEVALAALHPNGAIVSSKRSAKGRRARLSVLTGLGAPAADGWIRKARQEAGDSRFSAYDDWLDALVLAAGFGQATTVTRLPVADTRDNPGLPVHIHVPQRKVSRPADPPPRGRPPELACFLRARR
ncbi:MAG: DUF429 domain-containing protein [Opitutales bacterium]